MERKPLEILLVISVIIMLTITGFFIMAIDEQDVGSAAAQNDVNDPVNQSSGSSSRSKSRPNARAVDDWIMKSQMKSDSSTLE